MTVTSSRVSLIARDALLADVRATIGRQAGVTVLLRGNLNTLVTERLANVPIDAGIRPLSRWHSVVLIYAPSQDRTEDPVLVEAWVTVSGRTARPAEQTPGGTSPNDAPSNSGRPVEQRTVTQDARSRLEHRNPAVRVQGIDSNGVR